MFSRLILSFSTIFLFAVYISAATFTVTKTADSNSSGCSFDCSLREAIEAANDAPSDDVIEFDPFVFADQRSVNRPLDLGGYPNATGGDGSDIGAIELQITDFPKGTPFDFDGDRKTDVAVYRPANNAWWINRSSTNSGGGAVFGTTGDKLVPAYYTGDGKADIADFKPSNASWYVLRSDNATFYAFQFG